MKFVTRLMVVLAMAGEVQVAMAMPENAGPPDGVGPGMDVCYIIAEYLPAGVSGPGCRVAV